jgi:hypothetical protein
VVCMDSNMEQCIRSVPGGDEIVPQASRMTKVVITRHCCTVKQIGAIQRRRRTKNNPSMWLCEEMARSDCEYDQSPPMLEQ